jgi:hypothetical protein
MEDLITGNDTGSSYNKNFELQGSIILACVENRGPSAFRQQVKQRDAPQRLVKFEIMPIFGRKKSSGAERKGNFSQDQPVDKQHNF